MIDAGSLRDRVTFQRLVAGDDGYGNVFTSWNPSYLTVWANVRETSGKERVDAGRIEASRTATIRVRRSPDTLGLTEADRVLARGALWNIRSIAEIGSDRDVLDILCEAGVAA
jgi:SPP1 family predicted phage head-tail adaptor